MTDHIKAARSIWGESAILPFDELERFYAIAFKAGMERAAEICDEAGVEPTSRYPSTQAKQLADSIRAHAQNQPESIHDTGNVSKN